MKGDESLRPSYASVFFPVNLTPIPINDWEHFSVGAEQKKQAVEADRLFTKIDCFASAYGWITTQPAPGPALVTIMIWLVRSFDRNVHVFGLLWSQTGQLDAQLA